MDCSINWHVCACGLVFGLKFGVIPMSHEPKKPRTGHKKEKKDPSRFGVGPCPAPSPSLKPGTKTGHHAFAGTKATCTGTRVFAGFKS